jgi:hypothetical protein
VTDPKNPETKVPRAVRDVGEAVARDIKPALRLMGRIFFNTWLGDQSFVYDVAKDVVQKSQRARNATVAGGGEGTGERARASAASSPASDGGRVIIDAEIIEECATCGGTKKVGRPGHEIACPSCK